MKKTICLLLLLSISCLVLSIPLRVFYTNDSHGASLPYSMVMNGDTLRVGGYKALDYHLSIQRASAPRSIYLDAGDQQTGTAFAAKSISGTVGGAVVQVFNNLALNASIYGNHEFDHSIENTLRLAELANYPLVASNIIDMNTGAPLGGINHHIIELDSLSIGVIGLTLLDLPEKVKAENVASLQLIPYVEAIDRLLPVLKPATDIIILVTHLGLPDDLALAEELAGKVDLIIGGHSHHTLHDPVISESGIPILQSGSYLRFLGSIDLEIEESRIASYSNRLIPLTEAPSYFESPVSRFVEEIEAEISRELDRIIATIPDDWMPDKYKETILSRWMAEALRQQYLESHQPDIAILNNGGFRTYIPAGDVSLRAMHEMLPFNNYVGFFTCTGQELMTLLEINRRHAVDKPYDICQTSLPGWAAYDSSTWHLRINNPEFNLHSGIIEPERVYKVVSHDYVIGQWDKYLGFRPQNVVLTEDLILDAILHQLKAQYPPIR